MGTVTVGGVCSVFRSRRLTAVLVPEEDGGFSVTCGELEGAISCGEDREDALAMIKEAVLLLVDTYHDTGRAVPWRTWSEHVDIGDPVEFWIAEKIQ